MCFFFLIIIFRGSRETDLESCERFLRNFDIDEGSLVFGNIIFFYIMVTFMEMVFWTLSDIFVNNTN